MDRSVSYIGIKAYFGFFFFLPLMSGEILSENYYDYNEIVWSVVGLSAYDPTLKLKSRNNNILRR